MKSNMLPNHDKNEPSYKTSLRTLFIEDSEVDMELIVLELNREGFEVSWKRVFMRDELRKILDNYRPDIILSDYSMPGFSGIDALKIVREITRDIPFIFVSGTIGEERAIESIRQGATDYILKGNLRRLGTAVRRALIEARERELARATEEAHARLAAILEATTDFVAIAKPDLKLTWLNTAGRRLIGLDDNEDISDKQITKYHPKWSVKYFYREGLPEVQNNGIWEGETAILNKDGEEIPISQVVIGHMDSHGNLSYISTIGRDIRDRKAYEKRISYLANYDELTDLPNRTLLRDRVYQSLMYGRRRDRSIALLVVDIDRFKLVNDALGHEAGDVLLRMIGDRIRSIIRDGDTVARLGADAYVILAIDLHRPDDILVIVRKIHEGTRAPFVFKDHETHITMSIGASIFPRDGDEFDGLLRNAEAAMHRAKAQGRNGFEFYTSEMTREAENRMSLETDLRHALNHDELELYYQPQVMLETGRIVGVEALMRWPHKEQGWISPGIFIPAAEDSELILELGEYALSTACRQLSKWDSETGEQLRMSVNVSARQFRSEDFISIVERIMRATDIDPSRFELELTETILIDEKQQVMSKLEQLKNLNVRISVDDFGTGYSSLSYLSRLPIDCLKIDQTFVRSISTDKYNAHIVQAIISLAHSLELEVIAEGIETGEQLDFLRKHNCEQGQGFLYSRAVTAEQMTAVINAGPVFKLKN